MGSPTIAANPRHGAPPAAPEQAAGSGRSPRATLVWPVLLACLALSALTLLFPSTPTYDPWAWILWGREITQLDLTTTAGPSWKPLPVLFTVPFSIFGEEAAPLLWLWIARAGALLALAMSFRLARRFVSGTAGIVAGIFAAAFLLTSFRYVRDSALGNSEALLAALALWAFERHLDGRRDHALYLGFGAALLRPEVWPFLGLYGIWLWFREPELRLRMAALAALIPVLWFGPEVWGSGEPLRAASRANNPNSGSAAFADHPGWEVFRRFELVTIKPLAAAAAIATVYAAVAWLRSRRERATLFLAIMGAAWLLLVAAMTEAGFAGNQRYLILSTAAVCVLGGIGMGRIFEGIERGVSRLSDSPRAGLLAAAGVFLAGALVLSPVVTQKADNVGLTLDRLRYEAGIWTGLRKVVDKAGGPDRLLACGNVYSGPFQTQVVAYTLGIHGVEVDWIATPAPGVAFRTRTKPGGPKVVVMTDDRFREIASADRWTALTAPRADRLGRACPASSRYAPRVPARPETPALGAAG
ncbi:MAG: hypothetical protein ACR2GL_05095 [Thermoleophilaceae bacterium]